MSPRNEGVAIQLDGLFRRCASRSDRRTVWRTLASECEKLWLGSRSHIGRQARLKLILEVVYRQSFFHDPACRSLTRQALVPNDIHA